MGTEKERIKKIIEDMANGKNTSDSLIYDVDEKKVKPKSKDREPRRYIEIKPSDADLYR
jgi:hypothetical protein